MNRTESFEKILEAMSAPEFYPHEVRGIEMRETHISVVFLTGTRAYKLKKPKNLGFLDFRTLANRKRACDREVTLNRRMSRGIYIEVVNIFQDDSSRISLNPGGKIIEHAVKMVQLPDDANFGNLLKNGRITTDQVKSLGELLSAFYSQAERSPGMDEFGKPDLIQWNMEENFTQIQPFAEKWLAPDQWEFIRQVCRSFLTHHQSLFFHRMEKGRIRDGHGDLRTDHVYFHNSIQVIDCIEFNERFRYGDCALDLSFLIMDLDHLGYPDQGRLLLSVYAETARDPEVYALLDFYAAYRALVRLKVTCLAMDGNLQDQGPVMPEIRRYLNQAYQYAVLFGRPFLWVFCGLPASGKSTLARKVAEALFMPLFQSDVIRKDDQKEPSPEVVAFNTGDYRPIVRGRVYARLLNLALEELKQGKSVALDATFSGSKWRDAAVQLAQDANCGLVFIQCVCTTETMKNRLKQRETNPGESDARLVHLDDILKNTEPFRVLNPDTHMEIHTDQAPEQAFYEVLSKAYSLKCKQTKTLLMDLDHTIV
ncbi:MAG: AAA family ATPase [Desulfobacteraceae bacterium]|nr:AAA family ATPase [Desulfobacteraceae bacterium]MBU4001803.1 AAA family ATPase [Pseudomonadota bacterium]